MFAYSSISSTGLFDVNSGGYIRGCVGKSSSQFSNLSSARGMFRGCRSIGCFKNANDYEITIGYDSGVHVDCSNMFANTWGWKSS